MSRQRVYQASLFCTTRCFGYNWVERQFLR